MTVPHQTFSFSNEFFEMVMKTGSWCPNPSLGSFLPYTLIVSGCRKKLEVLTSCTPALQVEN